MKPEIELIDDEVAAADENGLPKDRPVFAGCSGPSNAQLESSFEHDS